MTSGRTNPLAKSCDPARDEEATQISFPWLLSLGLLQEDAKPLKNPMDDEGFGTPAGLKG